PLRTRRPERPSIPGCHKMKNPAIAAGGVFVAPPDPATGAGGLLLRWNSVSPVDRLRTTRDADALDQVLDVLGRLLGHLVDRVGDGEVDQRADRTEGFRRDAEEAVRATDQIDELGA